MYTLQMVRLRALINISGGQAAGSRMDAGSGIPEALLGSPF